jgi:hypothetical protein
LNSVCEKTVSLHTRFACTCSVSDWQHVTSSVRVWCVPFWGVLQGTPKHGTYIKQRTLVTTIYLYVYTCSVSYWELRRAGTFRGVSETALTPTTLAALLGVFADDQYLVNSNSHILNPKANVDGSRMTDYGFAVLRLGWPYTLNANPKP